MKPYKFSLTTESGELLGYCSKIEGLYGNYTKNIAGQNHFEIEINDLLPSKEFKRFLEYERGNENNCQEIIVLNVLDFSNAPIGRYYLQPFQIAKSSIITHEPVCKVSIIFPETLDILNYTFELWEKLRSGRPNDKGIWVTMSVKERAAWVEIVRIYHCAMVGHQEMDVTGRTIFLDGKYIIDLPSFFCAIGEAINGPAGYFGSTLDGLIDCLCGGFGIYPPFKLIWENSGVAKTNLNLREIEWGEEQEKSLEFGNEMHFKPLFDLIVEVFVDRNVELILC
jgi:RNAse (barnase) inhibitor barstar